MAEELINSSPTANTSPGPGPKNTQPVVKDDKFIKELWGNKARTKYSTAMGSIAPQMESSYHGQNTGVGKSQFDEDLLWGTDIDEKNVAGSLNEYRANQQGWGLQVGAGIARAGTKAATEIAKLPGVVIGGIAAIGAEEGEGYDTAFNNQWIKSLDNLNETINTEYLPVYVNKAVKEGNLWDNITSTAFWATDGADGLGYMLAMMAPGAMINKIGLGAKLVGAGSKAAKALGMAESLETGINGLAKIGFKGAQSIDMGIGVAANTIAEAGAEAKGVGDLMDAQKDTFVKNYPAQQLRKLQELDIRRRKGEINIDEYNQLSNDISNKTAEDSFKEQRAVAMADNFKMNLAVLLGPNLLMHQAIWGKAARKVESEVAKLGVKERIGKSAKRWGQAFLSEGFLEEGGQSTSERLFTGKAMRGELNRKNGFLGDFSVGELTNGYLDMVSSNEGQKAIFLGGVMGGPMMSYQGHKEDVNNIKESNQILARTNEAINGFNTIFSNDVYKKKEDGSFVYKTDMLGNEDPTQKVYDPIKIQELAIANHFTEERAKEFEQAVQEGNEDVVNEIKQQAVFDLILPSIYNKNGGLEVMEKQLRASQQFQEIVARDNLSNNTEKSSDFVKDILETVKDLQFQQEKFDNFSRDIISLNDPRANKADRESYINKLSSQYLRTKYDQYNAEKEVKSLEKQRSELLEDLGLNTNLVIDDEIAVRAEEINPLLRLNSDKIRFFNNLISKNKKDVAELWSGKDAISKSFKDYMDAQIKESERLSEDNVAKAQNTIDKIEQVQTAEELAQVAKEASKETIGDTPVIENPLIQEKLAEKEQSIQIEDEKVQDELSTDNESLARDKREEIGPTTDLNEMFGTEEPIETVQEDYVEDTKEADTSEPIEDDYEEVALEKPLTTIPSTDIVLDGNPLSILGEDKVASGEQVSKEIDKVLKSQQTGVKLISTIRNKNSNLNGQKLDFISQEFLDYERNGENKINTPVGFRIANFDKGNAGKAIKLLNTPGPKSASDLKLIYENLPISIFIPVSEDQEVESFIEGVPQPAASKEAKKIFSTEVLPLRKMIVNALINGTDISSISSHIVKQFPGVLEVEPQILLEDGRKKTPENSIADLQYFSNFKGNQLLSEISKRAYYVDYDGQLTSVNDKKNKKGDEHKGFGEVFLEIPQNNGKPFMLKLNYKALDVDKAGAIFEVFKVLSTLTPTIENPTRQSMTINEFLDQVSPEVRAEVIEGLGPEIKLVNDLHENQSERTLEKLMDYVIHQRSTNKRTRFEMQKNGTLKLGDLSPVSKITKDQLLSNDPQYKQLVTDFLQKKRHNILITKDDQATFQNPVYLQYILDNDILSTNAVVDEPTFQGYSNIYISNNLKGINNTINSEKSADLNPAQIVTTATSETVEIEQASITKSSEDIVMESLDNFEKWNLDISAIDTTQSPESIIDQISKLTSENEQVSKEFKKICGL